MRWEHCLKPDACEAKTVDRLCRGCSSAKMRADPVVAVRRLENLRAKMSQPEVREKVVSNNRALAERWRNDPRMIAIRREGGKRLSRHGYNRHDPEVRALIARKVRAIRLSWCPEEFWELNTYLRRKRILLDERKRIIAEEIAKSDPAEADRRVARERIAEIDAKQRARVARERAQAY